MFTFAVYNGHTDGHHEDVDWWIRIKKGQENALCALFRKYYKPLLNYGLKLVPEEERVKDSIQEVFCSIWDQRAQLSDIKHVRSYIYSSVRRAVLKSVRRQQLRIKRNHAYSETMLSIEKNREQIMIQADLQQMKKQALEHALDELTGRQKEAVILKFYNGLSNTEIAQVMGINKQSVYNYISTSIEMLQQKTRLFS